MRSYLTNLTRSVPNFTDGHSTSSKVTARSPRGDQPGTQRNPQTLLGFLLGQIDLGPRLLKSVLCYQGKSETENTCWQGHVSALLRLKVVVVITRGKCFQSCAVLFWFFVYMDSVRLAHLEEVWGWGDVEAKAALAGRRKIKKVGFKRESFSYPVPVPILGLGSLLKQTLTQSSWVCGAGDLPFCFCISGRGGETAPEILLKGSQNPSFEFCSLHPRKRLPFPPTFPRRGSSLCLGVFSSHPRSSLCLGSLPAEQLQIPQGSHVCPIRAKTQLPRAGFAGTVESAF